MTKAADLFIDRRDLSATRIVTSEVQCGDAEALLEIERFALTANNATYAVAGDSMGYWKFFPAADGWGRVPVWGFGRVVESRNSEVRAGERFYGYFPMGTHLVVRPARVGAAGFVDVATHRRELPAVYNQYVRAGEPDRDADDAQMLLRPLFMTSFLIDDYLADNDFFGARTVILSSASSKTAIGLAFELSRKRRDRVEIVGLTSPANAAFVRTLGYYDRVLNYDAVQSLDATQPGVFVDMAGNASVLGRIHEHFNESLRHSCIVGVTHWQDAARTPPTVPGPKPAMFFAPSQIQKRNQDWGKGGLERHVAADWAAFVGDARRWLHVVEVRGIEAMRQSYLEVLAGHTPADRGIVVSPGG